MKIPVTSAYGEFICCASKCLAAVRRAAGLSVLHLDQVAAPLRPAQWVRPGPLGTPKLDYAFQLSGTAKRLDASLLSRNANERNRAVFGGALVNCFRLLI